MSQLLRSMLSHYLAPEGESAAGGGAAAPAAGATPAAGAATPAAAAAGATGTPGPAAASPTNVVAGAGEPPKPGAAAEPPKEPTKEERAKFLTDKGMKAEDVAKLDDAGLKAKHDEMKAADDKAAALAKIDIKVPEGAVVDEKSMASFKEIIADANLSPTERGQKLFDLHAAALKSVVEEPVNHWMKTQSEWQATVKADAELGGTNLTSTEKHIALAMDNLVGAKGTPSRKAADEAFVLTGAGNHPEIVRLLARAGKLFAEGKHVTGNPAGAQSGAALQAMYPSASDSQAART